MTDIEITDLRADCAQCEALALHPAARLATVIMYGANSTVSTVV